jgi:hypothetical protein
LVIGFIEHFDTARDNILPYNSLLHTHTHTHTHTHQCPQSLPHCRCLVVAGGLAGWPLMFLTLNGVVRVVSLVSLSWSKKFHVRTSGFDCSWGSFTSVVDAVGFLALSSESSVDFNFRLLRSWNSSMDGAAVIVVSAVSPLAALSLSGLPSSRVARACTFHAGRYTPHIITSRHGPSRKHLFHFCCILLLPRKHACWRSRYLVTAVV